MLSILCSVFTTFCSNLKLQLVRRGYCCTVDEPVLRSGAISLKGGVYSPEVLLWEVERRKAQMRVHREYDAAHYPGFEHLTLVEVSCSERTEIWLVPYTAFKRYKEGVQELRKLATN